MEIAGLAQGTTLTVIVRVENNKIEFTTTVLDQFDDCIAVEPLLSDGKMLDFSGNRLQLSAQYLNAASGRIYGWDKIRIKPGILRRKDKCHIIHIDGGAYEINRRNDYRLYLGCDCEVTLSHHNRFCAIVRDISNNGVGVILDSGHELDIGSKFDVSFRDEESGARFLLGAVVVRIREFDGKYELGCTVPDPPGALPKFIAHKQLLNRKRALGMFV